MKKREKITAETCRSCGAYCVAPYEQESFCDLLPEDVDRLGKKFVRLRVLASYPIDAVIGVSPFAAIAGGA